MIQPTGLGVSGMEVFGMDLMAFDAHSSSNPPSEKRKSIAVLGSGISGLSASWLLSKSCDVTLFEKDNRIGGHSNTVVVDTQSGPVPVDTGFIVFNEPNYPNFTAMLDHLGVASENSCMSFGVSMNNARVEYSGQTISSVFARRSNIASPTFWKMLSDIPRFHRDARAIVARDKCDYGSLGDMVNDRGYGRGFCDYFLRPMAAAIWSTPHAQIFDYPAFSFLRFFANHGLLQVLNMPIWRTVEGGSARYVEQLTKPFQNSIELNNGAVRVMRSKEGPVVTTENGDQRRFDAVVLATHGDVALKVLADANPRETQILSAFKYQENRAVLHKDTQFMPRRRRAWSSWNYMGEIENGSVSYWMNRLQNLPCKENIFVTLNPQSEPKAEETIASFDYDHPMFNLETEKAQRDIWAIQGAGGVYYAGAHLGHGFHEDGLQAGLSVAEMIGGIERPWAVENASARLQIPQITASAA